MAKFCKECGTPLDCDSKFCKECGTINEDYVDPITGRKIMAEKAEQERKLKDEQAGHESKLRAEQDKKARIEELKMDAAREAGLLDDEEDEKNPKKKLSGGQIALIIVGIAAAFAIIIAVVASSSCSKEEDALLTSNDALLTSETETTTTKRETAEETTSKETTTEQSQAVDIWNTLIGTHTADDSSITITGSKNASNVKLSIYRLTSIDMTGTCDDSEITCKGLDPNNNEITARVYLDTSMTTIIVEITKSTWEYIPTGTSYRFSVG